MMAQLSISLFRANSARRAERRAATQLAHLSPHLLRDIGIDPASVKEVKFSKYNGLR